MNKTASKSGAGIAFLCLTCLAAGVCFRLLGPVVEPYWVVAIAIRFLSVTPSSRRHGSLVATIQLAALVLIQLSDSPGWSLLGFWVLAGLPPVTGWLGLETRSLSSLLDGFALGYFGLVAIQLAPAWLAVLVLPLLVGNLNQAAYWASLFSLLAGLAWAMTGLDTVATWAAIATVALLGLVAPTAARDLLYRTLDGPFFTALGTLPASLWRGLDVVVFDGIWFLISWPLAALARKLAATRGKP